MGLYLAPPDNAVVLCVDEKSQIQDLDRTAPMPPMQPGGIERRTHDPTPPLACAPQGVGKVGSGAWLGDELDGSFWAS